MKGLRPAKNHRIGLGYILLSSVLLGLPGVVAGAGLIYLFIGRLEPRIWLSLFGSTTIIELLLHTLSAHYWNRRAEDMLRPHR